MRKMKIPLFPLAAGLMALAVLFSLLTGCNRATAGKLPVIASEEAQKAGLRPREARIESAKNRGGKPEAATVQVTVAFDKTYDGRLVIRLFKKNGEEVGGSLMTEAKVPAGAERDVFFALPPDVIPRLGEVENVRMDSLPPSAPGENLGETAKKIVNELLE